MTQKLQALVSYVDDIAAALCEDDPDFLWTKMKSQGWSFSEEEALERFIGIVVEKLGPRHYLLKQDQYVLKVIQRYNERNRETLGELRPRKCLPRDTPVPGEEPTDNTPIAEGVRNDIGGLMYAVRGTRPDGARAVSALASCASRWSPEAATFLRGVMAYLLGTVNTALQIDARGFPSNIENWVVVGWGDADYRVPACQTGIFQALMSIHEVRRQITEARKLAQYGDRPVYTRLEGILPWEWCSQKQVYVKLSVAEAEVVSLALTARSVNAGVAVHAECISGDSERFHGDLAEPQPYDTGYVKTDNEAARLAAIRGSSTKMSHMNKTYGVSLGWLHDRHMSGELEFQEERTVRMLADPMTKVTSSDVFIERGVLTDPGDSSAQPGEAAPIPGLP